MPMDEMMVEMGLFILAVGLVLLAFGLYFMSNDSTPDGYKNERRDLDPFHPDDREY